jgi:hypothetical protein
MQSNNALEGGKKAGLVHGARVGMPVVKGKDGLTAHNRPLHSTRKHFMSRAWPCVRVEP